MEREINVFVYESMKTIIFVSTHGKRGLPISSHCVTISINRKHAHKLSPTHYYTTPSSHNSNQSKWKPCCSCYSHASYCSPHSHSLPRSGATHMTRKHCSNSRMTSTTLTSLRRGIPTSIAANGTPSSVTKKPTESTTSTYLPPTQTLTCRAQYHPLSETSLTYSS